MSKGKSPAFQCYPAELLNDEAVKLMSNREFGSYWKLICHNWTEGSIPEEMDKLALIVNEDVRDFETMWPKMAQKFRKKGTRLTNSRVEKERKKQKNFSNKMSESALKLWNGKNQAKSKNLIPPSKGRHSQGNAKAMHAEHSSSSSSLAVAVNTPSEYTPPPKDGPYKTDTPLQKAVAGWKVITGYPKDDRAWDKAHWPRNAASAKKLLEFLGGDPVVAVDCMQDVYEELKKSNLDCTLETVVKRSAEWKVRNGNNTTAKS